jgi:hypothetical protein
MPIIKSGRLTWLTRKSQSRQSHSSRSPHKIKPKQPRLRFSFTNPLRSHQTIIALLPSRLRQKSGESGKKLPSSDNRKINRSNRSKCTIPMSGEPRSSMIRTLIRSLFNCMEKRPNYMDCLLMSK